MSIKTEKEEISKAVNLLKTYEDAIIKTEHEGSIKEHILNLCKRDCEVDPYTYASLLQLILRSVAKPKVQKVMLEEISEDNLSDFINLLDSQIDFFLTMEGKQFETMLTRWDLEIYPENYERRDLDFIIEETNRKMKSCRQIKSMAEA